MLVRERVVVLVVLWGCQPQSIDSSVPPSAPTGSEAVAPKMPEHLQEVTENWHAQMMLHIRSALPDRAGRLGAWRWTDDERAAIEDLRESARAVIAGSSPKDRPWLLVAYAESFFIFGLGTEYADALIAIPPEHPAWGLPQYSLVSRAWEASDGEAVEACIHAVAELHDSPYIVTESLYFRLREADRQGDWDLAEDLATRLESIETGPPDHRRPAFERLNVDVASYMPHRMLRRETRVPEFCASALVGESLERRCLPELFPFSGTTLIVGSASWCRACDEVLPRALAAASAADWRVILIGYDETVDKAIAYRDKYETGAWLTFLPRVDQLVPEARGDLALRSIPFLALVDEGGTIVHGPSWLSIDELEAFASPESDAGLLEHDGSEGSWFR